MARRQGRGSSRPRNHNSSTPASPCVHNAFMRSANSVSTVSLALAIAVAITICFSPIAWAQVSIEDVHVAPRVEPSKGGGDAVDSSLKTHTRPMKVDVNLVLVPVTITDPMNRLVTGLDKENFTLFEGKEPQEIRTFSSEDAPVSIGVIFDMSGSMSSKIERAREAVIRVLQDRQPAGRVLYDHVRGQAGRGFRLHLFGRRHPGQAGVHGPQGPNGAA